VREATFPPGTDVVSSPKKKMRHYAPDGLNLTDIVERVKTCLETEFEFEFEGMDPYHKETPVCSCWQLRYNAYFERT
jgi:hypothetical protein